MEIAYFSNIRQRILEEIEAATISIHVAVCWFTNQELFDALCRKVSMGIQVELIILNDFINNREDGLKFQYFIDIGGELYFGETDRPMHNKYCIIDNIILVNGSYNWTYYAENKNQENIIIHKGNSNIIQQFINNFQYIKSDLKKTEKISVYAIAEIPDYNIFGSHNYLAQDYLYQAKETGDPSIVIKAFELNPENIQIQKKAIEFNLQSRRKTTFSIGEDVKNNGYTILIPQGTEIPYSTSQNFTTTSDYQKTLNITVRYGENTDCRKNTIIGSFSLGGIPSMKAGEPKIITQVAVDIYGRILVTKIIKQTNYRVSRTFDIKNLLEEF